MFRRTRSATLSLALPLTLLLLPSAEANAQGYGSPYGYGISNGQMGSGYAAGYGMNARAFGGYGGYRGGSGTVTNFGPLMSAITLVPGWNGPSAPSRPVRPQITMSRDQLLGPDGKILWPSAAPDDPARRAADSAVAVVVQEQQKYGNATVRHVVNARNKLQAFAADALPSVKTRNVADADELERFIVELKKTLATMTVNY